MIKSWFGGDRIEERELEGLVTAEIEPSPDFR